MHLTTALAQESVTYKYFRFYQISDVSFFSLHYVSLELIHYRKGLHPILTMQSSEIGIHVILYIPPLSICAYCLPSSIRVCVSDENTEGATTEVMMRRKGKI